jgi:hypothetical protein
MKKSVLAILPLLLLLGYRTATANSLSGVAVCASGLTTTDAVFDKSIDLLKHSGFTPSMADRQGGQIEASVTRYHTTNVGGSGSLLEDVSYWKLVISSAKEGEVKLTIDRGSALEVEEAEIIRFLNDLAVGLRLDPSRVTVTIGERTMPLSQLRAGRR